MHGQEIFQVFTDLNHSDLGLCTGYVQACMLKSLKTTYGSSVSDNAKGDFYIKPLQKNCSPN